MPDYHRRGCGEKKFPVDTSIYIEEIYAVKFQDRARNMFWMSWVHCLNRGDIGWQQKDNYVQYAYNIVWY